MEKLDWIANTMSGLVDELSHMMCTKMATLQTKQQGLAKLWPKVLEGYHLAIQHHLIDDKNSDKMLAQIENAHNMNEQLIPMFQLLQNLNDYFSTLLHLQHQAPEQQTMQAYLSHALSVYPFAAGERERIVIETKEDFALNCPPLFVETTLYHLFTRALQSVDRSKQELMWFSLQKQDNKNIVYIKLNTSVMPPLEFEHVLFEPYDKSRPGLAFCKLSFMMHNGDIELGLSQEGLVQYKVSFQIGF